MIVSLVEWSVRRAQGRLAQSLRSSGLDAEGGQAALAIYAERKFLALQLSTGRDPLKFVDRIAELSAGEPDPPELPRRRSARVVESISGVINVHWPAVKIIAVVLVLALLLASGKLTDAIGLLK